MNDAVILGLTGPTGAGKTTVSKILAALGCGVIDSDQAAREVTDTCLPCLLELKAEFGEDILTDGALNRKLLAARAFASQEKTKKLNSITHPWIMKNIEGKITCLQKQDCSVIVLDAPLLFEAGADAVCGKILAVTAPIEIRLERIIARDGISPELARARVDAQHEESYYTSRSDFRLDGTAPAEQLRREAKEILKKIAGGADEEN